MRKWTPNNAADLRAFLDSETGRMALERLALTMPDVRGVTADQALIEGCKASGYRLCLDALKTLAAPEKPAPASKPFVSSTE